MYDNGYGLTERTLITAEVYEKIYTVIEEALKQNATFTIFTHNLEETTKIIDLVKKYNKLESLIYISEAEHISYTAGLANNKILIIERKEPEISNILKEIKNYIQEKLGYSFQNKTLPFQPIDLRKKFDFPLHCIFLNINIEELEIESKQNFNSVITQSRSLRIGLVYYIKDITENTIKEFNSFKDNCALFNDTNRLKVVLLANTGTIITKEN